MKLNLSKDLTLVLLRGGGIPRTYNITVPKLRRNILLLSIIVLVLFFGSMSFLSISIYKNFLTEAPIILTQDMKERLNDYAFMETKLEEIQSRIDGRLQLKSDEVVKQLPIRLLSEKNRMIRNYTIDLAAPLIKRHKQDRDISLTFELHNKDSGTPARGYITVLAKTKNSILVYPENAFNPSQNIMLHFNKGETFKISRFRKAEAYFKNINAKKGEVAFHILIFNFSGDLIESQHIQEKI